MSWACATAPPPHTPRDACARPIADADWPSVSPESAGFDEVALCAALREAAASPDNVHALVLARRGALVAEFYREGRDTPLDVRYGLGRGKPTRFGPADRHDMRSISKSVVSLLVGITVDRGALRVDQPFLDAYPEQGALRRGGRERITVQDLLTMSAGLSWKEIGRGGATSDETPLVWKRRPVPYYFRHRVVARPGEVFEYAGGATMALADLLVRVNGKPLLQLAADDLFEPLGITDWEWVTNFHGVPLAHAGLRLRPRDLLKIGRLLDDGGVYDGRRIVSSAWIDASTQPHVRTGLDFASLAGEPVDYGHQWWTGELAWHGRAVRWVAGIGNGGQRLLVVPELDVVAVMTAGAYGEMDVLRREGRILAGILQTLREE